MPTGENRDRRDEVVDEFARLFNEAEDLGMEAYPSSDGADPEIIFSWNGHDTSIVLGENNRWTRKDN